LTTKRNSLCAPRCSDGVSFGAHARVGAVPALPHTGHRPRSDRRGAPLHQLVQCVWCALTRSAVRGGACALGSVRRPCTTKVRGG
jgi:hypothetical protein